MGNAEPEIGPVLPGRARASRLIELVLIFFGLPAIAAALVDPDQRFAAALARLRIGDVITLPMPLSGLVFPSLFAFSVPLLLALLGDPKFRPRELWNLRPFLADAKRMFLLMPIGFGILVGFAFFLHYADIFPPDRGPFMLLERAPAVVVIIFVFYPWFSCYPQELSHRTFFFHRYEPVLGTGKTILIVNAAAFSWLHAPFWNPWALLMTFFGGLLFAWTYQRTRSTLAVTIEHWLYGWWAFVTGAGYFVFAGSVGAS
ncbi:MAG: CPBP family intramembrane glutamic endopeptidase [Planctomycetota bacterium]